MEFVNGLIQWFAVNGREVVEAVALVIAGASIIVKLTPTLSDDNALKGIVKFLGKWVALDKYGPNGKE